MKPIAALALLLCAPAFATTGNEWLVDIESRVPAQIGFARGYASGVLTDNGYSTGATLERGANQLNPGKNLVDRFCLPDNVTNGQVWDVAHRYVKEHPELRQQDAGELIRSAFVTAWPCSNNPSPRQHFDLDDFLPKPPTK